MSGLTARDLAVARGGMPVLDGVSFHVSAGSALILHGPNGSGKTTLLRTLAGLQPPLSGEIDPGPEAVAYAAHANGMKGTLSVAENLSFWASVHGTREIEPALRAFDLIRLADRAAQHLSAGQARRLGLARMLVTGRAVWAMDEPTVSLDTGSVARLIDVIRGHLSEGGTAVISSHTPLGLEAEVFDVSAVRARPTVGIFG